MRLVVVFPVDFGLPQIGTEMHSENRVFSLYPKSILNSESTPDLSIEINFRKEIDLFRNSFYFQDPKT